MQSVSSCKIDDCFKIRTPSDFIKCPIWNEFISFKKFWYDLRSLLGILNPLDYDVQNRFFKSIIFFVSFEFVFCHFLTIVTYRVQIQNIMNFVKYVLFETISIFIRNKNFRSEIATLKIDNQWCVLRTLTLSFDLKQ